MKRVGGWVMGNIHLQIETMQKIEDKVIKGWSLSGNEYKL